MKISQVDHQKWIEVFGLEPFSKDLALTAQFLSSQNHVFSYYDNKNMQDIHSMFQKERHKLASSFFFLITKMLHQHIPIDFHKQTVYFIFIQLQIMSRSNRLRLRPLSNQEFKYTTPKIKEQRPFNQYLSNQMPRFKTQGDQQNTSIFPLSLSVGKKLTSIEKDPRKQYEQFRQLQLRNELQINKNYKRKKGVKLFKPTKQPAVLVEKYNKKIDELSVIEEVVSTKIKNLENNILHLVNLFTIILKKGEARETIAAIKNYVLQEESDLGDLEMGINEQKTQSTIKQIIYFQRVFLLLIVESLLSRKFSHNQAFFTHLSKDFLHFYSLIYQQITKTPLSAFLLSNNHKYLSQHTINLSPFSLFSIKDKITKKINSLTKLHGDFDRFVAVQLSKLKSLPTNLLYYNLLQFYATKLVTDNWDGWGIEFLSTCPSPYLHHQPKNKFTLLLDLDQTLVHYRAVNSTKGEFLLRPFLFEFLQRIQPHFQVGIFTCALKDYADIILEHLPTISIRFYRQHAVKVGKELVKDLSRVGRTLDRTILVDNLQKNFQLQKENGIHVRSWFGDANDTVLKDLLQQLLSIIKADPEDIRSSKHRRSFL